MSWRRDPGVPYQKLEEDTIVVDPRSREVHLLNDTAARIWELLETPTTIDALAATLSDEYDASEAELRPEVEELVGGLRAKGLVIEA